MRWSTHSGKETFSTIVFVHYAQCSEERELSPSSRGGCVEIIKFSSAHCLYRFRGLAIDPFYLATHVCMVCKRILLDPHNFLPEFSVNRILSQVVLASSKIPEEFCAFPLPFCDFQYYLIKLSLSKIVELVPSKCRKVCPLYFPSPLLLNLNVWIYFILSFPLFHGLPS